MRRGPLVWSKFSSSLCLSHAFTSRHGENRIILCSILVKPSPHICVFMLPRPGILGHLAKPFEHSLRRVPSFCNVRIEACYLFQRLVKRQFTITRRCYLVRSPGPRLGCRQDLKANCQRNGLEPGSVLLTFLHCTEMLDGRTTTIGILAAGAPSCFRVELRSLVRSPGAGTFCQLMWHAGQ